MRGPAVLLNELSRGILFGRRSDIADVSRVSKQDIPVAPFAYTKSGGAKCRM